MPLYGGDTLQQHHVLEGSCTLRGWEAIDTIICVRLSPFVPGNTQNLEPVQKNETKVHSSYEVLHCLNGRIVVERTNTIINSPSIESIMVCDHVPASTPGPDGGSHKAYIWINRHSLVEAGDCSLGGSIVRDKTDTMRWERPQIEPLDYPHL